MNAHKLKSYGMMAALMALMMFSAASLADDGPSRAPASIAEEVSSPQESAPAADVSKDVSQDTSGAAAASVTASTVASSAPTATNATSRAPASVKGTSKGSKSKSSSGLKSSKSIKGTKTTVAASGQKTVYQYTKYQKFDFEDMDIGTEGSAPGDLSITGRYQKQFQNKLPYRRNFRPEILEAIERIR